VTDDERDESIERLLRRGLSRDTHATSPSSCVDSETLAAWMDGSLSQETRRTAERHVAGCARCQAMLAAMARTAPEPVKGPWWRVTRQWLVPIAAAATALVVWIAVDRERVAPIALIPAETAAPTPAPPPPRPSASREEMASGQVASPPRLTDSVGAGGGNATAPDAIARTPSAQAKAEARLDDRLQPLTPETRIAPRRLEPTDRPAVMATRPPPPGAPPVPSLAKPVPPIQAREQGAVAGVPETVGVAETVAQAAGRAGGGQAPGASTDIVSPEPAFRWRLLAPSTIQRSTDGGVTWTVQSGRTPGLALLTSNENALPIVLTAGSSPARDICWIVGRGGVVLLSSNGIAWQRRPFPEAANLVAVRAADAKTAVVTTEDGRQFSTADGGATWLKIP
jgi:hypothetical protein